ncbi:MAG: toll/interleukin-1 receptor domain-containing protein [Gammaproteobacteria bacterium]|nr:toll/interleukin-1 receptor domain-containing protein [Gammaproteobacteria bacterium]
MIESPTPAPKYWAFISYSHRDAKWADWLHKSLESYRPPKLLIGTPGARGPVPRRLHPIFRDRDELARSTDLGANLNEALRGSASQIVICSPDAAKSRWVNEEILAFKRLGRADRIFCLIVGGEPNASDDPARAGRECFPRALRYHLAEDGSLSSRRTEPIAADARPEGDGRYSAKLKLIAGVLGVGYDALRRRDQQRRNRRLFALACGALGGMTVTSSLAVYALYQKSAALRQTARAEAEAETAKQTTRFLVDLFRISDPSEARGNKVTAREVLDKGSARLDSELAQQPAIQAQLFDTIGTVYMGLGLYAQASPLLDKALVLRRRLPEQGPQQRLVESLNHVAELHGREADFPGSERYYREAIALSAAARTPGDFATSRAVSLHGLGYVLGQQGRYADADRTLRDALALERRVGLDSGDEGARTLQDLAKVVEESGDIQKAIPLMERVVALHRGLHGSEPYPAFAEAVNDLGYLEEQKGNHAAAEALMVEALNMKRKLFGDKHPEVAAGLANLGLLANDEGQLARAEDLYRQALAMDRELLGEVHPDVADTLNNIAFVQADRGDLKGAISSERESLKIYRQLFPGDHPEVARIANRLGFWLTQARAYGEADLELRTALGMRQRLLGADHPDVASSLTHVAILATAQHEYAAALTAADRAASIFRASASADWRTAVADSVAGGALIGLGRLDEAGKRLAPALAVLRGKDSTAPAAYLQIAERYARELERHRRPAARVAASGALSP